MLNRMLNHMLNHMLNQMLVRRSTFVSSILTLMSCGSDPEQKLQLEWTFGTVMYLSVRKSWW